MTNRNLRLSATVLASAAAIAAQLAWADGMFCDDWSYNDPSCPSMKPSGKMAEGMVKPATTNAFCDDWSYGDPSCPAFPTATAAGGMQPQAGGTEGPLCSDWSYNDKSCLAYIKH